MAQKDCLDTFIHEIRTIVLGVSPARVFFFLLKSIADMKRWSTYYVTDHGVSQYCTQK